LNFDDVLSQCIVVLDARPCFEEVEFILAETKEIRVKRRDVLDHR
jgi:hypothetical protein